MATTFRNSKHRDRGWLNQRLIHGLGKTATTAELVRVLKYSERTLRSWCADFDLEDIGVIEKDRNRRITWNTERLRLWLIVRGEIRQPAHLKHRTASNPPLYSVDEAGKRLGVSR